MENFATEPGTVLNFASDSMQRTEIYQNDKVQQQNHFVNNFKQLTTSYYSSKLLVVLVKLKGDENYETLHYKW